MVVISSPAATRTGTTQDRIVSPLQRTVQAPQSATPQPNFVPVKPQNVAEVPKYRHLGIAVEGTVNSIYFEIDHRFAPIRSYQGSART